MAHENQRWTIGEQPWLDDQERPSPMCRVIIDNDFAGDPDDLYQLVHHLLSPAVEVRGVIGSHLAPDDPFAPGAETAAIACRKVREVFQTIGLDADDLIVQGAEHALVDRTTPQESAAATLIVDEARRDVDTPLYVVCGGGLTDLASAYLMEPGIAERLTVIWIGGPEYPGLALPPPEVRDPEYNLNIDVTAGQVLFNDSDLPLWQVPRNVYRQCLVSDIELRERVAPQGAVGALLYESIRDVNRMMWKNGHGYAETYALGDSPLVLLTALQSHFQPDPSSSHYVLRPAPVFDEHGRMSENPEGRPIRVYTEIDTRLMFEDFFLKLRAFARWCSAKVLHPSCLSEMVSADGVLANVGLPGAATGGGAARRPVAQPDEES
jgi:inosine-uridine nucleoside N-ribohydrolase